MKHYNIRVRGKVQGVFYRANTQDKAEELGLNGFVRNESDGSVYIECEGDEASLQKLIEWCHEGPSRAKVDELKVEEGEVKGFKGFQVQR